MRWLAAGLLAVTLAGQPAGASGPAKPQETTPALPAIALRDLEGAEHAVAEALGKGPLVFFFWSVYCPNCKEAMPGLVSLYERRRAQGLDLTVWAVNVDGDRFSNAVRAYVEDLRLPFPVVYDRLEGELLVAADPLGVTKTPTLFLADAGGRILLRQAVEVDYAAVEECLGAVR